MIDFSIISVDLETSSSDVRDGTLLTIGLVNYETGESRYYEARHQKLMVIPGAMKVNKISVADLDSSRRMPLEDIDKEVVAWLNKFKMPIPMGMNVGSFDMDFIKHYLPNTYKVFGYRSQDLNSIFYLAAEQANCNFRDARDSILRRATTQAEKFSSGGQHNALFDAYQNCFAKAILAEKAPEWMSKVPVTNGVK